jgi:GH35 family endo-1,4-beta-xylanase
MGERVQPGPGVEKSRGSHDAVVTFDKEYIVKLSTLFILVLGTSVYSLFAYGEKLPAGQLIITSENPQTFQTGGDGVFRPPGDSGLEKTDYFEKSVVPAENMPFTKAIRVRTRDYRGEPWGVEIISPPTKPIEANDVLFLTFYIRGLKTQHESGGTRFSVRFQRWGSPWTGWLYMENLTVTVGQGWKKFQYPFVCPVGLPLKKCMVTFWMGYKNQEVEIGGVQLVNYGKKVKVDDLPITSISYPGRELDATWRKAANERIEKYRKGDLTVTVTNANGQPVPDATVEVKMQKHAFLFGTELNPPALLAKTAEGKTWTPAESALYQSLVKKLFNSVCVAHFISWRQWERPSVKHEKDAGIQAVDWANENGLKVVGQALIWPKHHSMPDDLKGLDKPGDFIQKRIMDHIVDEATAMQGKIYAWMVMNEPHCVYAYQLFERLGGKNLPLEPEPEWRNDWVNTVGGLDKVAEWYKAARRSNPTAKLIINDSGLLTGGGKDQDRIKVSLDFYRRLAKYNTPVDIITEEAHFLSDLTDPAQVVKILDQIYADQKKEFWITEFDVNTPDLNLQADYLRDFLTATFSHPSIGAFLLWGFWEPNHWQPQAAMVRQDGSFKPAAKQWVDLIYKKWWTNETGKTDTHGKFQTRGFLGDYAITITANGKTVETKTFLPKGGNTIKIIIK